MRRSVERKPEAIGRLETEVDAGAFVLGGGDIEEGSVTETHKVTVIIISLASSGCQDYQEKKLHG